MKVRTALGAGITMLLVAALPAAAQGASLYTTLDVPNDVQGTNSEFVQGAERVAQAFTPASNGTARTVSLFGQTLFGTGNGTVSLAIYTNVAGHPGTALATGTGTIGETTAASPTCMVLNAATALSTAQTYWAVFRGVDKGAAWLYWRQQARPVQFSTNSGSTWAPGGAGKTFGLRVEDGAACGPDINPNPSPGTKVGDMYAKPGGSSFQTIFINNNGNQDLTLTGGSFSGPNASAFRLLRGEPAGPNNQPYGFPRTIGASSNGGEILYVVCDGSAPDGTRTATFTLTSSDPDEAAISWPVECLVDATPPSIEYTQSPNGSQGWFVTAPADLQARGVDPESGNRVKRIFCSDSNGPALDFGAGSITTFHLTGNGVHQVSCRATDVANNTSAVGAFPVTVKLDTVAPVATKGTGPASPTSATSAELAFTMADATSGVAGGECQLDGAAYAACVSPATRSGLAEGAHTFSARARDVAGNAGSPVTWTWRVDTTPPGTTLAGGPGALTTATGATFSPAGSDPGGFPGVTLQCALDGAAYAACTAPQSYAGLGEGHHVVDARAIDAAGNVDPTPASVGWDVDRTAPTARVASGPTAHTAATSATFAFAADSPGAAPNARFECRLDGAAYAPCPSPITFDGLAFEQDHQLDVRAVDTLGNVQAPPTTFAWRITNVPFATADRALTTAGVPVDVDVLANDVEPLGGTLTIAGFSAASAKGGTVTQAANGLRYAPPAGFVGTDTFTYRVKGSGGLESDPATVTVEVGPAAPLVVAPPLGGATPPLVGGSGPLVAPPAKDRTAPVVSQLRVSGRRLTFKLSEAAKVTIRVELIVKGRGKVVKRAGSTRSAKLGTTKLLLRKGLRAGRYRVTISAIDAAGNRSKSVRAGFRVNKKR
jgi:Bacterial Ig domain